MAVNSVKEKIVMKLKFKEKTLDGKEKSSSKSYTGIKNEASDQSIYKIGKRISEIQTKKLDTISKVETTILTESI